MDFKSRLLKKNGKLDLLQVCITALVVVYCIFGLRFLTVVFHHDFIRDGLWPKDESFYHYPSRLNRLILVYIFFLILFSFAVFNFLNWLIGKIRRKSKQK